MAALNDHRFAGIHRAAPEEEGDELYFWVSTTGNREFDHDTLEGALRAFLYWAALE